jgi:polysaccharide biosynthesis transport protein
MSFENLPPPPNVRLSNPVDIHALWTSVRSSWKSILGFCTVTSMVTALWVMAMDPIFRASATLMIESQQANTVSIDEVYGLPSANKEYYLTQFEILRSRDIAKLAIDELNLWEHPLYAPQEKNNGFKFNPRATIKSALGSLVNTGKEKKSESIDPQEKAKAKIVERFMGQLRVAPIKNTRLVKVSFDSTSRKMSAKIANTVTQVYMESHLDTNLQSTQEAGEWLTSRLDDLRANLESSQQALQAFRDKEELVDVAGVQTLGQQELMDLASRLSEARRARIGAENVYRELGGKSNYSVDQLLTMPAVMEHPLVQSISRDASAAEQEVSNLARRYGPEHPKMIAAISRQQSTREKLQKRVLQVAAGIENEYQLAQRNEQYLAQQLARSKGEVAELNRKEFRLRDLEKQMETDQRLYDLFFNRVRETSENVGFQSAIARVVETAEPPLYAVKPKKTQIVMISFMLSALIGVALVLLRQRLDNTIKAPNDVPDKLKMPLLGALPEVKLPKKQIGPYTGFMDDRKSVFSEAVRTIRTSLLLSNMETPHKITVITSTLPGEGKSTVAINLAAALSQMESVLLIDADLRRPTLAHAFQLPQGQPGLSNVLAESDTLESAICKTDHGFDLIPAGVIPINPQEMLSTGRFKDLLKDLANKYQRIIIDSAPVSSVSDSLILATQSDSLVYVVKADAISYTQILRNIDLIKYSNLPLTGVILNRIDLKKQSKYEQGGYYATPYGHSQT